MARLGRSYAAHPFISPPTTRTRIATATAVLGALVASATGVRAAPATASAPLGGLTGSASAVRTRSAAASAPLGGLTAAATVAPVKTSTAMAPLGGLVGTATAFRTRTGTASAPLGALTASAAGHRVAPATASATLGALTATATGVRTRPATATAPLGILSGTATGHRAAISTATAALGGLTATSAGTVSSIHLALPVAEFSFAAPTVTLSAGVTIGLPVAEFTFDAPAVYLGNRKPLDRIVGHLYHGDGLTHIAKLRIRNGKWREVVSQAGTASFDVPLADASTASITQRRVVKLTWYRNGKPVKTFSCEIRSEGIELAVDGRRWLRFADQPGSLIKLADGIVRPENGLKADSSDNRLFGWMSQPGPWLVDPNWIRPVGYRWSEMKGVRRRYPPQLRQTNPYWIGAVWPQLFQSGRVTNYFRATVTIPDGMYAEVVATADNFFGIYVNGEEVIPVDRSNYFGWKSADPVSLHLDAGTHLFAAVDENRPLPSGGAGWSPMGFIFALYELDEKGKHASTVLTSNLTDWKVHDNTPEPGWFRAQVLYKLIAEAVDYGYAGPTRLRVGFTPYHDSAGRPWTLTPRGLYSFAIGQNLASVTDTLTEAHFDVTFDHVTQTIKAWILAGRNRTASVHIRPADQGGNLKSGASSTDYTRSTEVLARRADGSWADVIDTAGVAAVGLIGTQLDLGTAESESTSIEIARSQLRDTAKPQRSFTSQPSTISGVIPYIHYFPGDYVSIPNARNTGTTAGRVLAITIDGSNDVIDAYSEIIEDPVPA